MDSKCFIYWLGKKNHSKMTEVSEFHFSAR